MIPKNPRIKLSPPKYRELIEKVCERDNNVCQECFTGFNLDPPHHIVFRSAGGDDSMANLVLLCKVCHGKKHNLNILF